MLPVLLGIAGIIVGYIARRQGAAGLGAWAMGIGAVSLVLGIFITPFFYTAKSSDGYPSSFFLITRLIFLFLPLVWHNALRRERVDFLFQFLDHCFFRHFPEIPPLRNRSPSPRTAGNSDVGFARFSGTVYGTAEERQL